MTPFVKATNNIKYFGLTLTKTMNDLYDNYFRLLNKEFDENSEYGQISDAFGFAGLIY